MNFYNIMGPKCKGLLSDDNELWRGDKIDFSRVAAESCRRWGRVQSSCVSSFSKEVNRRYRKIILLMFSIVVDIESGYSLFNSIRMIKAFRSIRFWVLFGPYGVQIRPNGCK